VTLSPVLGDLPPRATYVRPVDEVLADVAIVAAQGSQGPDLAVLLNRLAHLTLEATAADRVSLFLRDADNQALQLWSVTGRNPSDQLWDRALAMPAIPLADFPQLRALLDGEAPVLIPDASASPLVPGDWADAFHLQTLIAAPLRCGADSLGLIVVDYRFDRGDRAGHRAGPPTEAERLIGTIANTCALAVAHALVSQALKERNENLQSLLDASRTLSSPLSLDHVAEQVAESIVRVLDADYLSVHLLHSQRSRYRTLTQRNVRFPAEGRLADLPGPALRAVVSAWRGAQTPEPVLLPTNNAVVLPLVRPTADVFGFIVLGLDGGRAPTAATLELASALASHVAFAVDRVRIDEQMALGAEFARTVLALYEFDGDEPEGLLADLRDAMPPTLGFRVHGLRLAGELGDLRVSNHTSERERQIWKAWRRRKTRPAVHRVGDDLYAPVWLNGRVVGMVIATALRPDLAAHERELLEGLASALGHAIERIRMRAAVRDRERQLALAEERAHVASSLQSTIGRFLEAIQVCGEDIAASHDGQPVSERAAGIVSLARTARGELNQTSRSLPALTYDRGGLEATLAEVVGALGDHLDAAAAFEVRGQRRTLSVEVEQSLIRMVHETLSRVERNSRAGAIAVRLEFRPHEVELVIRDDGTDLATREQGQGGLGAHFGLRLVQRRLEELGGTLRIERPSPRGLELRARVPA
jgi:signal transduction histidine kinase